MLLNQDLFCGVSAARGFLPCQDPLLVLPPVSILNIRLNDIAKDLPVLLSEKKLRLAIDALNTEYPSAVITLEEGDSQQKNVAILVLLMLAQAYVWESFSQPANKIPAVLAKNLYAICQQDQRFPTLTYTDYILHNWQLKNINDPISLENIEPIYTFTGTDDEAWFIKVHVVIEAVCGKALSSARKIYSLAEQLLVKNRYSPEFDQEKIFLMLLNDISGSLQEATLVLDRMTEYCRPDYFWNILRLYLNGWEKVNVLDQIGVSFDDVPTKDKVPVHKYRGASGAQSSIIPALDATLGIKHEIDGMFQTLLMFKHYMPIEHQIFIGILSRSKVRQVIKLSESLELRYAWEHAINQIKLFRQAHMKLISQYIYQAAGQQGINASEITGTGGTKIDDYLSARKKSTENTIETLA